MTDPEDGGPPEVVDDGVGDEPALEYRDVELFAAASHDSLMYAAPCAADIFAIVFVFLLRGVAPAGPPVLLGGAIIILAGVTGCTIGACLDILAAILERMRATLLLHCLTAAVIIVNVFVGAEAVIAISAAMVAVHIGYWALRVQARFEQAYDEDEDFDVFAGAWGTFRGNVRQRVL